MPPQKMLAKLLMSKVVSCRCIFFTEDLLLYFVPKKICMDFAMDGLGPTWVSSSIRMVVLKLLSPRRAVGCCACREGCNKMTGRFCSIRHKAGWRGGTLAVCEARGKHGMLAYLGVLPPPRMPVTTRILIFLVYKLWLPTVAGRRSMPRYTGKPL